MKVIFKPSKLEGEVIAPPSKSLCHRFLICASLCSKDSSISNLSLSDDVLATIDSLRRLGSEINLDGNTATVNGKNFLKKITNPINCSESGSTLRFLIPFAFLFNHEISFTGKESLMNRPISEYENFCKNNEIIFKNNENIFSIYGNLTQNELHIQSNISSQFVSGLIFSIIKRNTDCKIIIDGPIESSSYIKLTVQTAKMFGANLKQEANIITFKHSEINPVCVAVEGDESNAAFLDALNFFDNNVVVKGLNPKTEQGDAVYHRFYNFIKGGNSSFDLANCPDLAPVLMAVTSITTGGYFINTSRLQYKESNRGYSMRDELAKIGSKVTITDNAIIVAKTNNININSVFEGHNDHRIVMALSVILSHYGGTINGAQAVSKSYPNFFEDLKALGANLEIKED